MFSLTNTSRKASITVHPGLRRAAALVRAFILLEDPEPSGPHAPGAGFSAHPHRRPLRPLAGPRRPGAGWPRPQHCLTPVLRGPHPPAPRRWTGAAGRDRRAPSR